MARPAPGLLALAATCVLALSACGDEATVVEPPLSEASPALVADDDGPRLGGREADPQDLPTDEEATAQGPGSREGHDDRGHEDGEDGSRGGGEAADPGPDAVEADGGFATLGSTPSGLSDVSGEAEVTRSSTGTVVQIELGGLTPDTSYLSHLHEGTCADLGSYYRFDPDGASTPPNELHLPFTTDSSGDGGSEAFSPMRAADSARAVFVHRTDADMTRVACADLS